MDEPVEPPPTGPSFVDAAIVSAIEMVDLSNMFDWDWITSGTTEAHCGCYYN